MNDERFIELALEQILTGLAGVEKIAFERELADRGTEGLRELDRLRESVAAVALTAQPLGPPAELRERLLRQVRDAGAADATPGAAEAIPGTADATPDAAEAIPSGTDAIPSAAGEQGDAVAPGDIAPPVDTSDDAVGPIDPVLPRRHGHRHSRTTTGGSSRGWLIAAAIATVLAVGLGALNLRLQGQLRQAQDELEEARVELAIAEDLRVRLDALQGDLVTVSSPETNTVTLSGTAEQPAGRARVFIDPLTGRALIFVYDLEVLGPDLVYQLWAIRGTTPSDAGVFTVNANGQGRLETENIEALLGADALAVTVEPAPGQPSPTGAIVLSS